MAGTSADTNLVIMTAVRQFAAGCGALVPDATVVDEAERMVRESFRYAEDPECHYLNDGALGFLLPLPNGDLVIAAVHADGAWLWGHAVDETPDDGRSYLTPGSVDDILATLAGSAATPEPRSRRPRHRSPRDVEPDAGRPRDREQNPSAAAA